MAVIFETSLGDFTIDLYTEQTPKASKNFLKLCKIKYYNNCLFYNIQKDFILQAGDPTNSGQGGESIYGLLYGNEARYFEDEIHPFLKHSKKGTVSMANRGPNLNGSQFFITLSDELHQLDEKHTVFGFVSEGFETLKKINETYTDSEGKPLVAVRIKHTIILDDPFDDPKGLDELIPDRSPLPPVEQYSELLDEEEMERIGKPDDRPEEEITKELRRKEAKSRAEVLEIIGDIPDAEIQPPDNVLFVCKLNAVTTEDDLELIFSRFGEIKSCEVIRDWKTGDSLCYAFIEFADHESAEQAYFKMDNVLIDDRRIHVDFSQSVSKLVKGKDGKTVRLMHRNWWGINRRPTAPSGAKKPSNVELKTPKSSNGSKYDMVFDEEDSHRKRKGRDSSPSADKKQRHEHRDRDRRDKYKDHDKDRGRDRDRDRDRDRRR